MPDDPITDLAFSSHALAELRRRGLREDEIRRVVESPEQRFTARPGRDVFQSRSHDATRDKTYLIRVFVDVDLDPPRVVTAYRTSKIDKYWR